MLRSFNPFYRLIELRHDRPKAKISVSQKEIAYCHVVQLGRVNDDGIMHFVYILESADTQHWYVGITENLERRIAEHNNGKSTHTSKIPDWRMKTYIAFTDYNRAEAFERYLKSHSGRAFTKKHL